MKNRAEIKQECKAIIRTAQVSPLAVTAIVLVVSFVLNSVANLLESGQLFMSTTFLTEYYQAVLSGDIDALTALAATLPTPTLASSFFSIATSLLVTVLMAGYYIYCIGIRQGIRMPYSSLLEGLSVAGKVIWCSILMGIKVGLWSLLFFFPGLVAAYRYRFSIYNILTDDSLSVSQAIRLSCEQTKGMKWNLFVLDLSFFGWNILSAMTMGLLDIWLVPYSSLCDLSYFEEGQRRLGRAPYGGEPTTPPSWEL